MLVMVMLVGCSREEKPVSQEEFLKQQQEFIKKRDANPKYLPENKYVDEGKSNKVGVKITVNSSYEYGYLKLYGVVENTGKVTLGKVRIWVRIYDKTGSIVLSDRSFIPEGGDTISPSAKVGYSTIQSTPGEPSKIRYDVRVSSYGTEITNIDVKYK